MDPPNVILPTAPEPILFRPSKKRKMYRQKGSEEEHHNDTDENRAGEVLNTSGMVAASGPPAVAQSLDELIAAVKDSTTPNGDADDDDDGGHYRSSALSVAEILRLRQRRRPKARGVEFRADGSGDVRAAQQISLVGDAETEEVEDEGLGAGSRVVRRFAPQIGAVGDVDRHMVAYIDSELDRRRRESSSHNGVQNGESDARTMPNPSSANPPPANPSGKDRRNIEVPRQPAALGKLMEIDLGDEARSRNVARTIRAQRRLDGEVVDGEEEEEEDGSGQGKKIKKVRLGRDGKPWRSRKRRGSEDVERDRIVEQILRENRLDLYEEPKGTKSRTHTSNTASLDPNLAAAAASSAGATGADDTSAADDRIAEEFRREFLEAVQARHRRRAAPSTGNNNSGGGGASNAGNAGGSAGGEVLKGPKLGGSRSARAAMREVLLEKARQAKR